MLGPRDHTGFRIAGLVHENEYVIPEKVLRTSKGRAIADALENVRLGRASIEQSFAEPIVHILDPSVPFSDSNIVVELRKSREQAADIAEENRRSSGRQSSLYYG